MALSVTRGRPGDAGRYLREGLGMMGTWGWNTFDNDDAMDWVAELAESADLALCEQSLNPEEIQGYYLEAPECVRVLCSAETLAALCGRPSPEIPEEVSQWVEKHRHLEPSPLIPKAIQTISRVLAEHSELNELWHENEADYPAWKAGVLDLRLRLGG